MFDLLCRRRALRWADAAWLAAAAVLVWPAPAGAVDVNRASAAQLQAVKGIGPRTAAGIVAERERGGPFASLDEVAERVRGVGAKSIVRLRAGGLKVAPATGRPSSPVITSVPRRPVAPPAGLSSRS